MLSLAAGVAALIIAIILIQSVRLSRANDRATRFRRVCGLVLGLVAAGLTLTGRVGIAFPIGLAAWALLFGWRSSIEGGAEYRDSDTRKGTRKNGPPASRARMVRGEALKVLGLEEGASEEEIRAAHRRLIQQLHPDKGGSNYLAAKINEAKEVLSEK